MKKKENKNRKEKQNTIRGVKRDNKNKRFYSF